MDAFLIGVIVGFAGAVMIFVFVNLESPSGVDELEGGLRSHTEGYKERKASLWGWIKGKFKKEPK